jgi:hypothetical protein
MEKAYKVHTFQSHGGIGMNMWRANKSSDAATGASKKYDSKAGWSIAYNNGILHFSLNWIRRVA